VYLLLLFVAVCFNLMNIGEFIVVNTRGNSHSMLKSRSTNVRQAELVKNEAIHRTSPVYSQMGYIGTGLALCKNIRSPAILKNSARAFQ